MNVFEHPTSIQSGQTKSAAAGSFLSGTTPLPPFKLAITGLAYICARSMYRPRIVDAAEIGGIVAFLASPRADAITGDAIAAGGGTARVIHY